MVGQKMPFLDPAFFLLGQFPEYFAQVLASFRTAPCAGIWG